MSSSADRLSAVLQRYERPLLGYAIVRCGDHGLAQDAVQETLLRFLRHAPSGDLETLAPWLFTTCRNALTDLHRKASRHPLMDSPDGNAAADPLASSPSPDEALEAKETAHLLRGCIDALPDIQQEVVRLKFETGLAYRDIAAATGLTIANVGWLLHQAVATLRADWQRLEAAAPGIPVSY
jgi:RNA polymerase sigma factor (sigma-70 family)